MAWYVPHVDISQSDTPCNLAMFFQGCHGCLGQVHQFVVWVEPEEVNGYVRSQIIIQPGRELSSLAQVISYLRNNEIRDFGVNPRLVPDVQEGLEDWLSVRNHYMLPQEPGLRVPLEVYSYTIEKIVHRSNCVRGVVTV